MRKNGQVYVIGDMHFGHNNILKFRKEFETVEEHDETIHNNILAVASKKNSLWLLGDCCFKPTHVWRLEEYANKFGTVNITLGNHDHPEVYRVLVKYQNVKIHGLAKKYGLWFSHAPVHPQELYRCKSVHGHVHSTTVPDTENYFNASCENIGYKPINLQEIKEQFSQKPKGFLLRFRLWLSKLISPTNSRG